MVPHAVRRFTGPDWRWILAYAVVVAPALLLAADIVGRVVIRPAELPAGIVTAFLGAPGADLADPQARGGPAR